MSQHDAKTFGLVMTIALFAFALPLALLILSDQWDPVDKQGL